MSTETCCPRIDSQYIQARAVSLALSTLARRALRALCFRRMVRHHFSAETDAPLLDMGCSPEALHHFTRESGYRDLRGVDDSPAQVAATRRLGAEDVEEGDLCDELPSTRMSLS